MTSSKFAVSRWAPTSGFTLVEIVLVIAIGVVFFGGAAVLLTTTGGDKDLIAARKQLEIAARSSREAALREGRKKVVVLNDTGVGGAAFSGGVEMDLITPQDLSVGRRGWGRPKDYQWTFTGGGLVEPIRVRLRRGANVEQFSFSALTGETTTEPAERP